MTRCLLSLLSCLVVSVCASGVAAQVVESAATPTAPTAPATGTAGAPGVGEAASSPVQPPPPPPERPAGTAAAGSPPASNGNTTGTATAPPTTPTTPGGPGTVATVIPPGTVMISPTAPPSATSTASDPTPPTVVPPRVEPATVSPAEELRDDIREGFDDRPQWSELKVSVSGKLVTISGTAPEKRDIDAAEGFVEDLAGYYGTKYARAFSVLNDATVSTRIEEVGAAKLGRLQALWEGTLDRLPLIGIAVLVLMLAGVLAWLISIWKQPYDLLGVAPLTAGLIRRVAATLVVVAAVLVAVELLDISALLGAVLGAAGVLGIALGFAFRDIIENYLAGLLLSLRHPFAMNDLLRLGEFEGKVVRLTSRETVLMTLDGNHVRIPNATVFKSTLINFTANPLRRFDFVVGVDTEVDLVTAQDLGSSTLLTVPGVLEHPAPFAQVEGIGESNVPVRFFGWVDQTQADFLKVRSAAVRQVKVAMDRAGIAMPEPTYQVRLQHVPHAMPALDVGDLEVGAEGEEGEHEQESLLRFPGIFAPAWGTTAADAAEPADEADAPLDGPKLASDRPRVDVSPDREVDRQIAREREESDEQNLLSTRHHDEADEVEALEVERRKQSG